MDILARRLLILVVDDDTRTGRVLMRMLHDDGFDTELAADGAAAIQRLAQDPIPDVLITDLQLPHADGFSVAAFARSREPKLPVFVVTGYPEIAATMRGKLTPEPSVYPKPFEYAELSEEIRRSVSGDRNVR